MAGGQRRTAGRAWLAASVLVLATVGVASAGYAAAQPAHVLVVADADTGDPLLTVPVEDGATVTLTYTHSVERTPVKDVYRVDDTSLDNTAMRFQSYGWGLPADADVHREGPWFVFDPDRRFDRVAVHPGPIAGHTLVVAGETHDLVALSGGDTVTLSVERRPLAARLLPA